MRTRMAEKREDAGFTLVELLVAMTLMTVVMVLTTTVLLTVQRQTRDNQARADAVAQVQLALARIDRQVRSGNVLYSPAGETLPGASPAEQCQAQGANGGTCMRVYTQSNGDQRCVQWQVTGDGFLRMRSWSTTWQTDSKVSGWETVARNLTNLQAGVTPFSLQPGVAGSYSPRVVDVALRANVPGSEGKDVDLTTSLTGRNTIYGYDSGVCSPVPNA